MKSQKAQHLSYLSDKGSFKIDCKVAIFGEDEIEILEKYGHWFEALVNGKLAPYTEKQELFIEVAKGKRKPFSLEEKAWIRYTQRKKIEEKYGHVLNSKPELETDPFYSREGAKHLRRSQMSTMEKNHWA